MYPPSHGAPIYRPAWWLPGPHLQTLWGRLARRVERQITRRRRLELADGDFLDLEQLDAPVGAPRLLVLHGLEGTLRSHYVQGLFGQARRRGWAADLLLFRSCGGEMNRLMRSYHSGETGDLDLVVETLSRESPTRPMVIAGVSLGGNVLLKWLGERGGRLPPSLRAAAAVSVPFDLAQSARHLERGSRRVYQAHFIRSLRRKARAKAARHPNFCDLGRLNDARTFREFDECVTAPVHGFAGAADYYARSSSLGFLPRIRLPTLLLSAADDPFLPSAVLRDVRAASDHNAAIDLEIVERGGHVGFVSGCRPWHPEYYAEERVGAYLAANLLSTSARTE